MICFLKYENLLCCLLGSIMTLFVLFYFDHNNFKNSYTQRKFINKKVDEQVIFERKKCSVEGFDEKTIKRLNSDVS